MDVLRILLVEDSPLDAELVATELADGGLDCAITRVETRADFVAALEREAPDVILCDYSLPAFDGGSALEIARRRRPEVPFLFVSGVLGEELAIETLKRGATDFVIKTRLQRLVPSVRRALREAQERAELKRAEQELKQAKEAAEAANRAKDQFLGVLGHELRTPLTPVLLAVSALLDDPALPAESRSLLEVARRNIELEARLIDDLLDLVRITRGTLLHHLETTDVHAAIRDAVETCRGAIAENRLALTLDLSATATHVYADPTRLRQVFWNLIQNAAKFTPAGGRLAVRSRNQDGRLIVEVADSGIGIEPATLERIFEPFEQGREARHRSRGGLGLGLALARSIVTAHGGGLTAASPGRGAGSTFTAWLPTVAAPVPKSSIPPPHFRTEAPAPALHVLLVEDDPATSTVLARLLRRGGFTVTTADRVATALEAAQEAAFDVIVSDLGLPDGSGLDLLPQLQSRRAVPAIALTGYGAEDDVRRCHDAGFAAHLTKPVEFARLQTLIRQLADTKAQGVGVPVNTQGRS